MHELTLVIGTRNYSSWSLRPWMLLRHLGLEFRERLIHFDTDEFAAVVRELSPSRRVPVLLHGPVRTWESLAICEYASELADGRGWPTDRAGRAQARALAAEMHASFAALRSQCPMNARARDRRVAMTPELGRDIRRIDAIWSACPEAGREDGPWLFGRYSAADAMFSPVVLRCLTYDLPLSPAARRYLDLALGDPVLQSWIEASRNEGVTIDYEEVGQAQ